MKNQKELSLKEESEISQPLFSIVTVSYNSEKTIERTIKSILSQTESDYEYWIIDGCSSDGTMDIVKRYQPLFKGKLFSISEPDLGIYNAMNKGIEVVSGKIIGIVNSDDWLEEDALENIRFTMENVENPYDSIYCGWVYFHYNDGGIGLMKTDKKRVDKYHKKFKMGVRHPATFVSATVYKQVGVFDESYAIKADHDFIFRCMNENVNFYFIDKVLTNMSDGGVSNNKQYKKKRYEDLRYFYSKYTISYFKYHMFLFRDMLAIYIKGVIPQRLLEIIRHIR